MNGVEPNVQPSTKNGQVQFIFIYVYIYIYTYVYQHMYVSIFKLRYVHIYAPIFFGGSNNFEMFFPISSRQNQHGNMHFSSEA